MNDETIADEALVRASACGDEQAFAQLVHRYLRKAMAVAMAHLNDRGEAEEVVQDAFRKVAANLTAFDQTRRFAPWFFTILRNGARNAAERQRVRQTVPIVDTVPWPQPGPQEELERRELLWHMERAIAGLPEMQRICFRLCAIEGLSAGETSNATGVAETTVRVHVFRARRTLQGLLAAWREQERRA